MAAIVIITDGCGLRVEAHRINQPNKSKLSLYKTISHYFQFNIPFKQLYTSNKQSRGCYFQKVTSYLLLITFRQYNILQLHITVYKGNIVILLHITFVVIKVLVWW